MALGKTSAFSKLDKKEEQLGTQSPYQGPGLGGDASRGGGVMRSLDEVRGGIGKAENVLNKAAKMANQGSGFDTLGGGTGRTEDAYQSQRAGERNLTLGNPTTGGFDSLWGSGQPLAPALPSFDLTAPDTTFSMPTTGDQPITGAPGLGGGLGGGDAGSFLGGAAGGAGAAGGLMSLAMDAKNGNWGNIAKDLIGLYGNASQLSNGTIPSISELLGKGVDAVGGLFGGGGEALSSAIGSAGEFAGELGGELGGSLAGGAAAEGAGLAAEGGAATVGTLGSALSSLIGEIAGPIAPILPFVINAITNSINGVDPWSGEPYRYARFLGGMMNDQRSVSQTLGKGGTIFPYAQNQDELKYQIANLNREMATEQNSPVEGASDWTLGHITSTGPRVHGKNITPVDTGATSTKLNEVIAALRGGLPMGSGNPFTPEDEMRLATQFMDRPSYAPKYLPSDIGAASISPGGAGENAMEYPGMTKGFYADPGYNYNPNANFLRYGDPGYDYTDPGAKYGGANFPKPGEYFGGPSTAWNDLMKGPGFASLGTNSNPNAPGGAGQVGGQKSNLQGTLGFAGLTGPLNEIRGGDNPNQI